MLGLRVCNWKWRLAEWMLIALLSQLIIAHSWRLNWNYSDDALSSKQVNWQHQQQPGGGKFWGFIFFFPLAIN